MIAQRLRPLGYNGGITVVKHYLRAVRKTSVARRAFVRMEPAPADRCDIDRGVIVYNGGPLSTLPFCLIECPTAAGVSQIYPQPEL